MGFYYEILSETFNQLTIEPIKHKYCNFAFILQSISFMFFYWIYFDNISDNDNYEYDWTVEASCSALYLSSSGNCCDIVTPPTHPEWHVQFTTEPLKFMVNPKNLENCFFLIVDFLFFLIYIYRVPLWIKHCTFKMEGHLKLQGLPASVRNIQFCILWKY